MSQEGVLSFNSGGGITVETIQGNTGGPVGPDASHNLNIVGNTTLGITVVGNPGTNTLTIVPSQATTTQFGVVQLATNAQAIAGTDTAAALTSDDLKAKLGVQTSHGVAIGSGTSSAIAWTGSGSSGQVLTSNGPGLDPTFQANASGDVVGPAGATDNAVARFDGSTGKLIKNSVVTVDNTGITFIPTQLGIGAAASTSALYINSANRIGAWITGNNVSTGSDADGLFVDASFNPSSNVTNCASIGLYPTFAPPGGVTITTGYGLYIASGTQGGAGSVTTGYGLYVTHPTFGSTNYSAQIDNIRIDLNTIEATNANGTMTLTSAGTGAINIGTNATAHATTVGSTTASATTTIQGPSAGVFMTGVAGVAVANLNVVTINTSTGALGSAAAATGDVVGPAGATSTAIAVYSGATGKLIANSIPTIDSSGNILTSASLSGATLSIDVVNSSNTASSAARLSTTVAGSTAADPHFQASVSGGQVWTWGLDNSASDAYVLASSASLGTTNVISAATSGEINYPLQPAFLGTLTTSSDDNVTGNGALYTLGTNVALTEIFDQNSDFNTNGTFTAPVTGAYFLGSSFNLTSGALMTSCYTVITTSNRTYLTNVFSAVGVGAASTNPCLSGSVLADMDAADTAITQISCSGAVGDTGDLSNVNNGCKFFGNLTC